MATMLATDGLAQPAAPITVTPPTLAPERRSNGFEVAIPEAGALSAPAGSEDLTVALSEVHVEGGFAEVAAQTDAIIRQIEGRRVSLREIYSAASAIEAAHARAGFVLARVSVPPQNLGDDSPLRIVVTDGFIESIDVAGVPAKVRKAVYARASELKGRRHLRLRDIEQPLLIANDVPGITLRSTLMRGTQPGGTRLVLEGSHQPVSARLGAANQFDPSLGTYGVHAELSLNSLFGQGEQIYGFIASGYELNRLFAHDAKVRVLGGGIVMPLGDGRLTLNPEVTFSRTRPAAVVGTPQTLGTLRRLTVRSNYTLMETRRTQAGASLTLEQIDERSTAPDFAVVLSHDRYMVARVGLSWSRLLPYGASYGFGAQLSQGLGDFGAISRHHAIVTDTPFSRVGSNTDFSRLNVHAVAAWPVARDIDLALEATGQTTFGMSVFRAEQFTLEGSDGLSAYVGGASAVDEGVTGRIELRARAPLSAHGKAIDLSPYLFAAAGTGRIAEPTRIEPDTISAANIGLGVRGTLASRRLLLAVEYGHGLSDYQPLKNTDRVSATLDLHI